MSSSNFLHMTISFHDSLSLYHLTITRKRKKENSLKRSVNNNKETEQQVLLTLI